MRITEYTIFFLGKKKTPKGIVHSFRAHTPVCSTYVISLAVYLLIHVYKL